MSGVFFYTKLFIPTINSVHFFDKTVYETSDLFLLKMKNDFLMLHNVWVLELTERLRASESLEPRDLVEAFRVSWYNSDMYNRHHFMLANDIVLPDDSDEGSDNPPSIITTSLVSDNLPSVDTTLTIYDKFLLDFLINGL